MSAVELLGRSGVGKSYIVSKLVSSEGYSNTDFCIYSNKEPYYGDRNIVAKMFVLMKCILGSPKFTLQLLKFFVAQFLNSKLGVRSKFRFYKKWFFRFIVISDIYANARESRICHVFERGVFANVLSVIVREPFFDYKNFVRLLDAYSLLPSVIIAVEVDSELLKRRRSQSNKIEKTWMGKLSDDKKAFSVLCCLLKMLEKEGKLKVKSINNRDKTTESNCEAIVAICRPLISN